MFRFSHVSRETMQISTKKRQSGGLPFFACTHDLPIRIFAFQTGLFVVHCPKD